MNKEKLTFHPPLTVASVNWETRFALWWLRHYEEVTHFWRGFSWIWVIGVLCYVIAGYLDFAVALPVIFIVGIVTNAGIYFGIRAIAGHLKDLEDGPEKEEAHRLMVQIIRRRALKGV